MNENVAQLNGAKPLPDGWRWMKLQHILDVYDSGLWGIQDLVQGIPVIRSVNFCNDGSISVEDIAKVIPNVANFQHKKLVRGDILLERSGGGPKQPVGRVVLFNLDGEFYFGNFISRLRCNADVDPYFLFSYLFILHIKGTTLRLQDQTTGIRNLRFSEYLQLPIPLPVLPEQKRIAVKIQQLMTEAQRTRTACEAQLEAIKTLPQAILRTAFSGEL